MASTISSSLDIRTLAQAVRLKMPDAGDALDRIQSAFNLLDQRLTAITTTSVTGATSINLASLPTLPASKVNIPLFYLTAAAFTDHSPGATAVAWTGAKVTYLGIPYSVADGNTTSTYIVWDVGTPNVFSGAASPPTVNTSFLVGVNRAGNFSFVWDKPQVDGLQIQDETVGTTQLTNLAVTNAKIANATIDIAKIANLSVGGGTGRPGTFNVYDGSPAIIGKIGDLGSSNYGIWGKQVWAGGTGPADAPFKSDTSGRVSIDATDGYSGGALMTLVKNSVTTTIANTSDSGAIIGMSVASSGDSSQITQYAFRSFHGANNRAYMGTGGNDYGQLFLTNSSGMDTVQMFGNTGVVNLFSVSVSDGGGGWTPGVTFSGAVTNITVVGGVVTAAS